MLSHGHSCTLEKMARNMHTRCRLQHVPCYVSAPSWQGDSLIDHCHFRGTRLAEHMYKCKYAHGQAHVSGQWLSLRLTNRVWLCDIWYNVVFHLFGSPPLVGTQCIRGTSGSPHRSSQSCQTFKAALPWEDQYRCIWPKTGWHEMHWSQWNFFFRLTWDRT